MSTLTLKEDVTAQHIRLTAPDRPCDRCHELAPAGETLQIATIRFPAETVAFSICNRCASAELDRFKAHTMSHDAANIFLCAQEPEELKKLTDELVRMNEWIGSGEHCDECGGPLVAGEPVSTATVATSLGRSILHRVCLRCKDSGTPNIKAKCERFVARMFSTRATAFIQDLIAPKKVVN